MNLFELFVKIGVDDQASKKIETISEKLGNGLQNAAKVAKAAMTVAGTGIVALGKIGLEYNAQIESYTTDFEVMMGDAEAAARKVEELKEMGAKTPFELGDLASATKTLLAFNVSADDSTGVLQQLGDISLGNVQKLESLTRAYGKMNASQKVTLEDINMMIDAGFNPLLLVAEKTGETMDEVYDRISKGGVSFEEISVAINQATSEGGLFYQGMDKASQTTQGLVSTLKDAAQSKIGELFSDISEKIKELLPNVISFVENIDTDKIVTGVENLMQAFNDLLPVITGVTAATVAYKAAITISSIIEAVTKATQNLSIAQAALNAVMNMNPFVLVATLITGLIAAIITLWTTNEDFRNAVIEIWEAIKNAFTTAWQAVKDAWGAAKSFFQNIWDSIKNVFSTVKEILSNYFSQAWDAIKNAVSIDKWKKHFSDLWDTVKDVFKNVKSWFKDVGKNILTGIWNGISDKVQWLKNQVSGVVDKIKSWFTGSKGFDTHSPSRWSKKVFQNVMIGGEDGIISELPKMLKAVQNASDSIKNSLDIGTTSVGFESSGVGISSAGIINGFTNTVGKNENTYTFNLLFPDGTRLASYMLNPLVEYAKANGTPILNPV